MKKIQKTAVGAALFILILCAASSACKKEEGSKEGAKKEEGKKKVAFIARTQNDSFAAWLANAMKEEAAKTGTVTVDVMDGQDSDEKINSFIENSISNRYAVIIAQPQNTEAQKPAAEAAVKANIPFITVNLRIPGMETVSHSVDASPYEQGAVNARYALDLIPQGARVVILNGPADHPHSNFRREAWQKEFLDKRPDVTVLAENYANWKKDEAMRLMEDWVQTHGQNGKIDAVLSMNDNMASGAIEAVKGNAQYADMLVFGVDGTAEAALLIQEGKMTSTSFQNAYLLAETSMKIVGDIVAGNDRGFVNIDIECPLITKENVQFLIDTHKRAGALQ
ncbi:MAG: sugar ABC transporter substrate-binding protein [Spirochaetaceae bacterium]|jgi:inositol transport system substrate-binding protein|nr:sugar ABC transporter substrate-binding protein [Spirochaetaceae bacterium]